MADAAVVRVGVLGLLRPTRVSVTLRTTAVMRESRPARQPSADGPAVGKTDLHAGESLVLSAGGGGARTTVSLPRSGARDVGGLRLTSGDGRELVFEIVLDSGFRRVFRGSVEFREASDGTLAVVVERPLESYVAGAVQSEHPPGAPAAALQALSTAVRSYASAMRGRHGPDGFDLCDCTHCMLYQGEESVSEAVRQAVAATSGKVFARGGRVLPAVFTPCCGGELLPERAVWPEFASGVRDRPTVCPWCRYDPQFFWKAEIPADALARRVGDMFGTRGLSSALTTYSSKEGPRVVLSGPGWVRSVGAEEFRVRYGRLFGWNTFLSNRFSFSRSGRAWRVDGRGRGHGAGLCVAGAAAMASEGADLGRILAFYMPGIAVEPVR